jgi:stage V sporulation protein K
MDKELNNTINHWSYYSDNVPNEIVNMWNFILYNQFNNEEIRRLHREVKFLKQDKDELNDNINCYKRKIDDLNEEVEICKKKLKRYQPKKNKKRKINLLLQEYNKIKKKNPIEQINNKEKNKLLLRTFSKLNSISDIINLKNHPEKYQFLLNSKFIKLYNIIPVLEDLNNVIGMDNVKDSIFKSICYFIHNFQNDNELNHVIITGPPGVGKTTIAKIIGKIYLELGFLDNNIFNIVKRSDLIAKYLGQTAIKTQEAIDNSIGGVMFIDEVYSLGNKEGGDSYAKECIDTINLNMTRDEKWLLIVGGYEEDINNSFLSYNKGLERRFTVKLNIDGYNAEELFYIFIKFVKDNNWEIKDYNYVMKLIEKNYEYFKFFAGDMLKIFQKAKEYYSLRILKESIELKEEKLVLSNEDINNSIKSFIIPLHNKDVDNGYIFTMYT